jgi:hypothetical protein
VASGQHTVGNGSDDRLNARSSCKLAFGTGQTSLGSKKPLPGVLKGAMRRSNAVIALVAGGVFSAALPVNEAAAQRLTADQVRTASVDQLVASARDAQIDVSCQHFDWILRVLFSRSINRDTGSPQEREAARRTLSVLENEGCPRRTATTTLQDSTQRFSANFNAGLLQVRGAEQSFLGTRVGGVDIFPLQRFQVTQSGQFFGANLTLPEFGGGQRLTLGATFFQSRGLASAEPTSVSGAFLLVPGVTTPGFSFNNVGNLAALGPQQFNVDQRGFAFSGTYEFSAMNMNGFSFVPLLNSGFAVKNTDSRYRFTIPGYDTTGLYSSVVNDMILRLSVGVRAQTTLSVGNVPVTFFAQGTIGAAHHQAESQERFDISIFSGAITAAEQTSIRGSATGLDWMTKFGANWPCQWLGGRPLQVGVSAFIGGDTRGGITRSYQGGIPNLVFEDQRIWGGEVRGHLRF